MRSHIKFFFITALILSCPLAHSFVKVIAIKGEAYAFFGKNKNIKQVTPGSALRHGSIIATAPASAVTMELQGNGVIVLGPRSQIYVGDSTKLNKQHIRLLKGQIHFQTKGGQWSNREAGAFITVKDRNMAYIGKNFSINYTQGEKSLLVKKGEVKTISLREKLPTQSKTTSTKSAVKAGKRSKSPSRKNESSEKYEDEFEQQIDYMSLIKQQTQK